MNGHCTDRGHGERRPPVCTDLHRRGRAAAVRHYHVAVAAGRQTCVQRRGPCGGGLPVEGNESRAVARKRDLIGASRLTTGDC